MEKERNEGLNVGGVSIKSRNDAPSRKGSVVNGLVTWATNKSVRPSPPHVLPSANQRFQQTALSALDKTASVAFIRLDCPQTITF